MTIDLPFGISDIVYTIDFENEIEFVAERKIYSIEINEFGIVIQVEDLEGNTDSFVFNEDWEESYFPTRNEAEYYLQNGD